MDSATIFQLWDALHKSYYNIVCKLHSVAPAGFECELVCAHNDPFVYLSSYLFKFGDRAVVCEFAIQPKGRAVVAVMGDIGTEDGQQIKEILSTIINVSDGTSDIVDAAKTFSEACEREVPLILRELGIQQKS